MNSLQEGIHVVFHRGFCIYMSVAIVQLYLALYLYTKIEMKSKMNALILDSLLSDIPKNLSFSIANHIA